MHSRFVEPHSSERPPECSGGGRRCRGAPLCAAASLLVLLAASGCNSGGSAGGSGKSGDPGSANGSVSGVAVTALPNNRFQVDFVLSSNSREELGVDLEYSEDMGTTYSPGTTQSPPISGSSPPAGTTPALYLGTPSGTSHSLVWLANSDLTDLQQHDLVVRLTPYDPGSGDRGTSATSASFGIGANSPPVVTSVSTPAATVGGRVTFDYTTQDPEADHVRIEAQYSLDGGVSFSDATLGGGDGTDSLATSGTGIPHTIQWHAQEDVPETFDGNVQFRIRALDTDTGPYDASGIFSIRTHAPIVDLLTVNRIPRAMNGSTTFRDTSGKDRSFTLALPESGFVIWVEFSLHPSGAAVDPAGVELSNSSPIGGGAASGGYDADADFGALASVDVPGGVATMTVGSNLAFATGAHTLTVRIRDVLGNVSQDFTHGFDTLAATNSRRPFEHTDRWSLEFTRDNFSISSSIDASGDVSINTGAGANGVSDFVEDLRVLGLNSESPPPAATSANLNDVAREWVKETVVGHLNTFFGHDFDGNTTADSVNIEFHLVPPPGSHSRIAIGGDDPVPGFTIGRAEYDYRNSWDNNNTDSDLGVFTTNLIEFYINSSFTFRAAFDALIPGRGTPLGFHADDVTVLSPGFDRFSGTNTQSENDRYDDILDAVDALARVVATILAHEIGHSVGLVANGAPAAGLFGGESDASFAGPYTTAFHLDTNGNNIMAAAVGFSGAVQTGSAAPAFNEMNLAYLQERILLD